MNQLSKKVAVFFVSDGTGTLQRREFLLCLRILGSETYKFLFVFAKVFSFISLGRIIGSSLFFKLPLFHKNQCRLFCGDEFFWRTKKTSLNIVIDVNFQPINNVFFCSISSLVRYKLSLKFRGLKLEKREF